MSAQAVVLSAVSILVAYSILRARQGMLMVSVMAYAAVVAWIIHHGMEMLMFALGGAIGLGVLGLGVMVWRLVSTQNDSERHSSTEEDTNNDPVTENIGS